MWRTIVDDWDLEDHQERLLEEALLALDRADQARTQVDAEGITLTDRFGQVKAHPAVAIERDARVVAARLLRELNLELDDPPAPGARPPRAGRR